MTKAYKNNEFLMSPEARTIRMLAEYLEPRKRFETHQAQKALIFFGSARTIPGVTDTPDGMDYYDCARDLAARMARWTNDNHQGAERYFICSGGGPGIMEATNRGAADVDVDLSMGLNISLPFEQHSNPYISPDLNLEFHYFFMRKFWFLNLAAGLAIFPGGFGTMDELFEVLTLVQTGKKHRIPLLMFGEQFWNRLINFDLFIEMGLISPEDKDLFLITSDLDAAEAYLTEQLPLCEKPRD